MEGFIRIDSLGNISGLTGEDAFPVEPVFIDEETELLQENCIKYLGKKGCNNVTNPDIIDDSTYELIQEGIDEARALSDFRMAFSVLDLEHVDDSYSVANHAIDLTGKSLKNLFDKNHSECVLITASTLGDGIDKRVSIYKDSNTARMVLLNACSSAYVEYLTDISEKLILRACNLINPSFRFAPGYGDVPLSRQRQIFSIFEKQSDKLKIELNDNNFMYPIKSMTGITGCRRVSEK